MQALRSLSGLVLRDLAQALVSGQLQPNSSPFTILRAVQGIHAAAAAELADLLAGGLRPEHAAKFLAALASERACHAPAVELVTTGPDAAGTTRDTAVVMRELFASARSSVLVVGFAVHRGRAVFQTLAHRMTEVPSLQVRLCLDVTRSPGDTSHAAAVLQRFVTRFACDQWPSSTLPAIYYDPRALAAGVHARAVLHAKCVVVDNSVALVGSANLTEAAQQRNIEVGVLIRDARLATGLERHFDRLIKLEKLLRAPGT